MASTSTSDGRWARSSATRRVSVHTSRMKGSTMKTMKINVRMQQKTSWMIWSVIVFLRMKDNVNMAISVKVSEVNRQGQYTTTRQ